MSVSVCVCVERCMSEWLRERMRRNQTIERVFALPLKSKISYIINGLDSWIIIVMMMVMKLTMVMMVLVLIQHSR